MARGRRGKPKMEKVVPIQKNPIWRDSKTNKRGEGEEISFSKKGGASEESFVQGSAHSKKEEQNGIFHSGARNSAWSF